MSSTKRSWSVFAIVIGCCLSFYGVMLLMGKSHLDILTWFALAVIGFLVLFMIAAPFLLIIQPMSRSEKETAEKEIEKRANEQQILPDIGEQEVADAILKLLKETFRKPINLVIVFGVFLIVVLVLLAVFLPEWVLP